MIRLIEVKYSNSIEHNSCTPEQVPDQCNPKKIIARSQKLFLLYLIVSISLVLESR
jgi:hypothetical protein